MANLIQAILNIVNNTQIGINNVTHGNNRANNMGMGLEEYIQDVFANTFNIQNPQQKLSIFEQIFSFQGNKNNPPDLILKNSDSIEIKKLESYNTAIALNSSYPKSKLFSNSSMITTACRTCEDNWIVKDMLYAIGNVPKNTNTLKSLWFVYGDCFCADKEIYERIKDTISNGITSISNVEFTETNELGKVKKVDPLGITDLRIRGMWHIENPAKIFNYIYQYDETKSFQLICLMKNEKYHSFSLMDRQRIESLSTVNVSDVRIKNPNNPVNLFDAKLIVFKV